VIASRPTPARWPLFARGGLSLLFGLAALLLVVLAILMPGIVAAMLLILFGCFVLIDAGLAIGRLILTRLPAHERLGVAARAVMTLSIALAAFAGPITAGRPWERLGAVVSIWAVLNGLLDMAIGAGVFGGARRRWHVVMGAVSVVLGASLLAWPPGMIALTLWIVLFSALYGAVTIVEASRGVRVE